MFVAISNSATDDDFRQLVAWSITAHHPTNTGRFILFSFTMGLSTSDPIIIIGAGSFGLSAALHLSQRGYTDVSVFGKDDYAASGDLSIVVGPKKSIKSVEIVANFYILDIGLPHSPRCRRAILSGTTSRRDSICEHIEREEERRYSHTGWPILSLGTSHH